MQIPFKRSQFQKINCFICDYETAGTFGFVLNRKENLQLGDLLTGLEGCDFPVYYGGPVQMDSMHFLHQCPKLISGGVEITDGIFWGGNFEEVVSLLQKES